MDISATMCLIGVAMCPFALLCYIVAFNNLYCPDYDHNCDAPYSNISTKESWVQIVCACHALAFCLSFTGTIMLGVALCCRQCRKDNKGFMASLIVILACQVILSFVPSALFATEGKMMQNDMRQYFAMFILVTTAGAIGATCLALAIVATVHRKREED